jgi:metallo-beta-lactamase family protein
LTADFFHGDTHHKPRQRLTAIPRTRVSRIDLTFHGGVGAHASGGQYLLELAKARFYFDTGLVSGPRTESAEENRRLPVDPRTLNAVLLTHAHLGHCGRLPYLVRNGFRGQVWATPATRDLCAVTLPDTADMLAAEAGELRARGWHDAAPLFDRQDARQTQELMVGLPYRRPTYLRKNLFFEFTDAGHIPGSASIALRFDEGKGHRLVYSGDIGRPGGLIVRDPEAPTGPVDTLIIGAGGAGGVFDPPKRTNQALAAAVKRVVARGGTILVPALPAGRSQEFLAVLHQLAHEERIPRIPVVVDSDRVVDATALLRLHPEIFWRPGRSEEQTARLFDLPLTRRRSGEWEALSGSAVIIAGPSSCALGPVRAHLARLAADPANLILFLRRQVQHTPGRRIQDGITSLELPGGPVPLKAEVLTLEGFSGHGDREDLRGWLRSLGGPVHRAFVVHGDDEARAAMGTLLTAEGVKEVIVPGPGQRFRLQ